MDITPYVTTVEDSLVAAAAAGDEETRRTAAALTAALEPALRLAIMEALSDLALEVSEALGDYSVELRLEPGQVGVVVMPAAAIEAELPGPSPGLDEEADGELSRVTLRLPESLKARAERAAAGEGISLNTWLARAVRDTLQSGPRQSSQTRSGDTTGHRVRGWVQA
jgi:hypothetical protein